jgi:hypothetical protein
MWHACMYININILDCIYKLRYTCRKEEMILLNTQERFVCNFYDFIFVYVIVNTLT